MSKCYNLSKENKNSKNEKERPKQTLEQEGREKHKGGQCVYKIERERDITEEGTNPDKRLDRSEKGDRHNTTEKDGKRKKKTIIGDGV
jgi:hypothetical protein